MQYINGIPLIWDHEADKKLFGQLYPNGLSAPVQTGNPSTDPLASVRTTKSFEEITYEKKFGTQNKCAIHQDDFYSKELDLDELLDDLHKNKHFEKEFFYYQKYTFNLPKELVATPIPAGQGIAYNLVQKSIPYKYLDKHTKKEVAVYLKVALNTRACYVNFKESGYKIKIDEKNQIKNFHLEYIYADSLNKRKEVTTTQNPNDYTIDPKYVAMTIETENCNDFLAITQEIGIQNQILIKLKDIFANKLIKTSQVDELKFLYENCPDEVILLLKSNNSIKEEILWEHLQILTKYDKENNFLDSSNAVIKIFKLIGYSYTLFQKFAKNQAFVKTIYQNLDGFSIYNKQQMSNKTIFANFLHALCIDNQLEGLQVKNKTFKYGPKDTLDSNVSLFSNENNDEIFLQQLKKTVHYYQVNTETDDFGVTTNIPAREQTSDEEIATEKGNMYKPLDIVFLCDTSQENPITIPVPAILVKALSDEVELQQIQTNIRIGFDVLAIIAGVVTLVTTATPGVLALAIADIALATGDIGVQSIAEELQKTPEGREFLETWEKIYMVGGITTAVVSAPQLVQSFYNGATKFIKFAVSVKNYNYLNFARSLVLTAYLEASVSNFIKNTVRILNANIEIVLATSGSLNQYKMLKLEEKGVFLLTGTTKKGVEEFAMLFKGKYVAKGNKASFYKQLKKVAKNYYKEEKLVEVLEEMEDDVWKYFDKELASGNHYETKDLENIYKFGSKADFEKGVKYLTKKEREAYEIFVQHDKIVDAKGNLVDTNGSISILEDGQPFKTEKAIFVMSEDGKIYLSKNYEYGKFHHSSFLSGEKVAAAGEIFIEQGVIKIITDGSGHYKPSLDMVKKNIFEELSNRYYFSIGTNKQSKIKFNHGF